MKFIVTNLYIEDYKKFIEDLCTRMNISTYRNTEDEVIIEGENAKDCNLLMRMADFDIIEREVM